MIRQDLMLYFAHCFLRKDAEIKMIAYSMFTWYVKLREEADSVLYEGDIEAILSELQLLVKDQIILLREPIGEAMKFLSFNVRLI